MKKKVIFLIIFAFVFSLVCLVFFNQNKNSSKDNNASKKVQNSQNRTKDENSYLVEGYPIEAVPLHKLTKVSSSKIFVNTDPKNRSAFDTVNYAYYNVVLYTEASQEEFLSYYRKLFESEYKEEYPMPNMVKGNIGKYRVTAAHYDSGKTGYIQVHLPDYKGDDVKKYFESFPDLEENSDYLVEHEQSYGLLNQKGGETEYTKYYTVVDSGDKNNDGKDDVNEFLEIENKYIEQYGVKHEYGYDQKTGTMKWTEGRFAVTLVISRDHGRIYLNLRKSIGE